MSKLIIDAGKALYGDRWQSALARDLDVSDRTVRRWVAGDEDLSPGTAMDLWRLCEERAADLDEIIPRLKRASAPA